MMKHQLFVTKLQFRNSLTGTSYNQPNAILKIQPLSLYS